MKRTLISLAVLGCCTAAAHAQSNVTIYGVVDTGYVKETGRDVRMGTNQDNKIGFRGQEDLGNGLKATFELERRFDLNDGSLGNSSIPSNRGNAKSAGNDWDGAANVGIASNTWGRIRFGRVNELSTETIRRFDPFYQYGVGSQIMSLQRSARVSNTARYDSPKWSGFSFGALYTLGQNTKEGGPAHNVDWDNDGYGINLSYNNGPFIATANWSRLSDSNDSSTWNIGLGYKFANQLRLTLTYEDTDHKGRRNGTAGSQYSSLAPTEADQQNWLLGVEWDIGPGQLDASVQYNRLKHVEGLSWWTKNETKDTLKYALGYTYNLSKRTSVYGQVAYTSFDDNDTGRFYYNGATGADRRDSVTAFQVGMTHKF
ncbi:MAG: porin [Burkholderiaceae bacterium]|jgi:predicted porin|nr:porin [Burkholderiaceae bacterium]